MAYPHYTHCCTCMDTLYARYLCSRDLYTRYPIVARALGLAECAREQRNLAYNRATHSAARPSARATIGYLVYKWTLDSPSMGTGSNK